MHKNVHRIHPHYRDPHYKHSVHPFANSGDRVRRAGLFGLSWLTIIGIICAGIACLLLLITLFCFLFKVAIWLISFLFTVAMIAVCLGVLIWLPMHFSLEKGEQSKHEKHDTGSKK